MHTPRRIDALKKQRIASVAAGENHSVALSNEGRVYAWGSGRWGKRNRCGQPSLSFFHGRWGQLWHGSLLLTRPEHVQDTSETYPQAARARLPAQRAAAARRRRASRCLGLLGGVWLLPQPRSRVGGGGVQLGALEAEYVFMYSN